MPLNFRGGRGDVALRRVSAGLLASPADLRIDGVASLVPDVRAIGAARYDELCISGLVQRPYLMQAGFNVVGARTFTAFHDNSGLLSALNVGVDGYVKTAGQAYAVNENLLVPTKLDCSRRLAKIRTSAEALGGPADYALDIPAPVREYRLQRSYVDEFGGPALVPVGSTGALLSTGGFRFDTDSGLSLTNGITAPGETYSLTIDWRLAARTEGFAKLLDFSGLVNDEGLYVVVGPLGPYAFDFYDGASHVTASEYQYGERYRVTLTRNGATKEMKLYVSGILKLTWIDAGDVGVFSAAGDAAFFLSNDTGQAPGLEELAGGTVFAIAIRSVVLTPAQILNMNLQLLPGMYARNASGGIAGGNRYDCYFADVRVCRSNVLRFSGLLPYGSARLTITSPIATYAPVILESDLSGAAELDLGDKIFPLRILVELFDREGATGSRYARLQLPQVHGGDEWRGRYPVPVSTPAFARAGWALSAFRTWIGCGLPDAIDANLNTRWTNGGVVDPVNDYFQIDTNALQAAIGAVVVNNSGFPADTPLTGDVYVSSNGVAWTRVSSWTAGKIQPNGSLALAWLPRAARYVQLRARSAPAVGANWWSIGDINLYAGVP